MRSSGYFRYVYRKGHTYNPEPQIPGGLSVNSWLIEPSTLCEVPGIFDMCVVNMVVSNYVSSMETRPTG